MHAAIHHQEDGAAGLLAVHHARQVDARLADEVPAEFDDHARVRQLLPERTIEQHGQVLADGGKVERAVPRRVRDTEAAAEVQVAYG